MRYSREGGFRWNWLARLTNGRLGLGKWTQAEVDSINERAEQDYREMKDLFE